MTDCSIIIVHVRVAHILAYKSKNLRKVLALKQGVDLYAGHHLVNRAAYASGWVIVRSNGRL